MCAVSYPDVHPCFSINLLLIVLAPGFGPIPPVPPPEAAALTLNVTFAFASSIVRALVTGFPSVAPLSRAFRRAPV